jgi:hypothetical protein
VSDREHATAPQLLIREIRPEERLLGFRVVKVGDVDDPDLPLSFQSHHDEGLHPRYEETEHAALHVAISFWRTPEPALALGRRFPKHGRYLAKAALTYGLGFDCLDQSAEVNPQHLAVWGSPERLAEAVVEINPIEPTDR